MSCLLKGIGISFAGSKFAILGTISGIGPERTAKLVGLLGYVILHNMGRFRRWTYFVTQFMKGWRNISY